MLKKVKGNVFEIPFIGYKIIRQEVRFGAFCLFFAGQGTDVRCQNRGFAGLERLIHLGYKPSYKVLKQYGGFMPKFFVTNWM